MGNDKTSQIVKDRLEEFKQYNNYTIQASKSIYANERRYNVSVALQVFTDDEGMVKMIREI